MKSLIRIVLGAALFAASLGLAGCSSDKREHVKWYDTDSNTARRAENERTQQPTSVAAADRPSSDANDSSIVKPSDDATVTKTYDPNGTLTELRNFDGDPSIKYVLVRTAKDGQKQGVIGGSDGRMTPVPADLVNRAMSASTSELAAALKAEPSKNDSLTAVSTQPVVTLNPEKTSQSTNNQTASSIPTKAIDLQQTKQSQPAVVFDQLPRRKG